jgi:hypothetical protein
VARPLRFRYDTGSWTPDRVAADLRGPLDANMGAAARSPWYAPPSGYEARRFEMDNGDVALFCWSDDGDAPEGAPDPNAARVAYWIGNTETPSALWKTEKYGFEAVPYPVARWAQRELLAQLHEEAPWLAAYPHLSWFFLPVLLSKDGRESTRAFLRKHAAGFPDADPDDALAFYESVLSTGALDGCRHVMAGKLGTSEQVDHARMCAAMGEFNAAKLLLDAGYEVTPEIDVDTGHALDYRASRGGDAWLVEVTRPRPVARRRATTPAAALRETADTKASGQLSEHGDTVLFVDCTSFPDDDWNRLRGERPQVGHEPAVVYRLRPDGAVDGWTQGAVPVDVL